MSPHSFASVSVSVHAPLARAAGCCLLYFAVCGTGAAQADDSQVLARVNGTDITAADLELQLVLFRPESREDPAVRQRVLEQLIDRSLISAWLDDRNVEVDSDAVEARIDLLKRVLDARGQTLDEVLAQFGRTLDSLRAEQALPVRWRSYVRRVTTQDQIAEYFSAHRAELDGTQVRVNHIAISIAADASEDAWSAAEERLALAREEIASGDVTFADAARMHSDSPSAEQGGDLGFIHFRGDVPIEVSRIAFSLDVGSISEPIRSTYGVHLVQVTDRQPGQLSLEDVRNTILEELGDQLWETEVARLSETATIERFTDAP